MAGVSVQDTKLFDAREVQTSGKAFTLGRFSLAGYEPQ